LVAGLHRLGVPAAMNPVDPLGVHNTSAACFEVPSAYEVTIGEKKLIGSAQTRPQGRVLQHGSLPLTGDITRVVNYLWFQAEDDRAALAEHLRERATTLRDVLGRPVSFDEAAKAIAQGFADALALDFETGKYSDAELESAERIAQEKADQFVPALEER
ncbi:MAG: lipoate--protein ligase family protein, partial [Ktedonobacterales bacterium]